MTSKGHDNNYAVETSNVTAARMNNSVGIASHFEQQYRFRRCLEYVSDIRNFDQKKSSYSHQDYIYANGKQFTVMSYNILAQDLLELHPYLYERHDPNSLKWENRLKLITDEINKLKPEILCLQEVQDNHLCVIIENLEKLNYNCIYKKKTGIRNDGCAIFYSKYIFDLVEWDGVEFCQPNVEHLDRENVALIAKFSVITHPNAKFLVSTTHLLYNPKRQDVRLAQVQVLLAELDRLSVDKSVKNKKDIDKINRIPIILTGDFNFQPHSAPYRLIVEGNLQYHCLNRLSLESSSDPDSSRHNTGLVFLPPSLGITDNCKHIDILKNNYESGRTRLITSEFPSITAFNNCEIKYPSLKSHRRQSSFSTNDSEELTEKYPSLFSTGQLTHDLNLESAYKHYNYNGEMEATTFQHKWVTVDHIFYSKNISLKTKQNLNTTTNDETSTKTTTSSSSTTIKTNTSSNSDDIDECNDLKLKLLMCYKLPIISDCRRIGRIPNSQFGSDHFSIAAKFLLYIPHI